LIARLAANATVADAVAGRGRSSVAYDFAPMMMIPPGPRLHWSIADEEAQQSGPGRAYVGSWGKPERRE
jgi:hypothetical protein